MDKYKIQSLYENNLLQDIDLKFSDLLTTLAGDTASAELSLAGVLVSNITSGAKHICLDIKALADRPLATLFNDPSENLPDRLNRIRTPVADTWAAQLKGSTVVGRPGEYQPLILDRQQRLYLYRYWTYEHQLAAAIKSRTGMHGPPVDRHLLQAGLRRYFDHAGSSPNWQKVAAYAAATNNFCIISGGPGTGKTHTVTHILALLLEQDSGLKISLCAPTGKAAARLQESIKKAKQALVCAPSLLAAIPEEATTIHRLLGVRRNSPYFYHDSHYPLSADILIVDEASMVSLALMAKLVLAAADQTRVILLGDKNQLASVEAGAVLGDICEAADTNQFSREFCDAYAGSSGEKMDRVCVPGRTALSDCAVELKFSYRFDESSAIGTVSQAVNRGDISRALELIETDTSKTVIKRQLPGSSELESVLAADLASNYADLFRAQNVQEAFSVLETFRILCSHRKGPYGVKNINLLMETIFQKQGFIDMTRDYYPGRPIMILSNHYSLKLYNGDVGIIWEDETREKRAYFPDRQGGFRTLAPVRLPAHETVYAMTIHKSQGSEFDQILMILPPVDSPVFTRELVYTGITRARCKVEIWANDDIFNKAVTARVERRSGLRDALLRKDQ